MTARTHKTGFRWATAAALTALALSASACQGAAGGSGGGSNFPTRNISVVVPYPAGSGTDTVARAIVEVVNEQGDLGAKLQVINKEGGAGAVGTTDLLNSKADGYTIGLLPDGPLTLIPHVQEVAYDREAVTALPEVVNSSVMLVVPANSPYKTTEDLIEAAKDKPGTITLAEGPLNYAVPATMFEQETGTSFKRVPFDGDGAASTALLGNNVDVAVMQLAGALPQLESGALRALGIASAETVELAPDVPTFVSQGIDLEWEAFYFLAAPDGLPEDVEKTLTDAITAAVKSPEFADMAKNLGLTIGSADGEGVQSAITKKFDDSEEILTSSK